MEFNVQWVMVDVFTFKVGKKGQAATKVTEVPQATPNTISKTLSIMSERAEGGVLLENMIPGWRSSGHHVSRLRTLGDD